MNINIKNTTTITFLGLTFLWFWIGLFIFIWFPIGIIERHININYTNSTNNLIFQYYTWLGDGFVYFAVLIWAYFKYRLIYNRLLLTFIIQTISVQISKSFIFKDFDRPLAVLGSTFKPNLVVEITTHMHNSFPSGHTATAFSLAACISLIQFTQSKAYSFSIGLLLFTFAVIVAYSRVYLFVHFFRDVVFGTLYGIISFLIAHYILIKYQK